MFKKSPFQRNKLLSQINTGHYAVCLYLKDEGTTVHFEGEQWPPGAFRVYSMHFIVNQSPALKERYSFLSVKGRPHACSSLPKEKTRVKSFLSESIQSVLQIYAGISVLCHLPTDSYKIQDQADVGAAC